MDLKTALDILHLDAEPTLDQAKRAYRTLAKQYHPDVMGQEAFGETDAEEKMKDINLAFRHLAPLLKLSSPVNKEPQKKPGGPGTPEKNIRK
nr:DnaJ domain-containing protein [Desulfobacula sp.]